MNRGLTFAQNVTTTASVLQIITAPIAQSILIGMRNVAAVECDISVLRHFL
ncbi:Uncharacterised protein [Mycobacterium tuberculosis]|nr:Uncharacterised protein [Mycobacterium tuberculosis]